jgi:NAD(P)-dependent dehydrogenase (short-subunit alcohol dehydrogenase family)
MALYLVTGASSGIGEALCRRLVQRGDRVVGVARDEEKLAAFALGLGPAFTPMPCDVSDREAVSRLGEALPELPDVVILSAGIGRLDSRKQLDATLHERIFATNYFGVLYVVEALLPRFRERGRGVFVGISSLAARRGMPRSVAYAASKAALSSALESMRMTWGSKGIRFIRVEPGFVATPMTAGNGSMPFLMSADEAARRILRGVDKGRLDIVFPWPMALLFSLLRLLPERWYARVVG